MRRRGLTRVALILLQVAAFTVVMGGIRAPGGQFADIVLLTALGLALAAALTGRRFSVKPYQRPMVAASIFFACGLLGTFVSPAAGASLANGLRFMTATVGLSIGLAIIRPTADEARRVGWAYVAGAAISSLVSFTDASIYTGRSDGLALHVNALGVTSAMAFALCLGLATGRRLPRLQRAAVAGCLALLVGGVLNSGSRAALGALLVGTVTFLFATRRLRLLVAGGLAVVLTVAALATGMWSPSPTSALGRALSLDDSVALSNIGRDEAREKASLRIGEHYITGSGFAEASAAHSLPIQATDVGGVVGLFAFGWLLLAVVRPLARLARDPAAAGFLALTMAYIGASLVSNAMWDRWIWLPILVGVSYTSAVRNASRPQSSSARSSSTA